jgi:23S rRNA (cytosine1962-C5)-methyltransferase
VIDTSSKEKLERWGKYILVRPDPQVIWNTLRMDKRWTSPDGHYHRSNKGGGEWDFNALPEKWKISYDSLGLKFWLQPFAFKHTGIFPEQAANWDWFSSIIDKAVREDGRKPEGERAVKVLNLFAYTGGATLAAAAAGARVTHVDASKGMVGWAKENAVSSGLGEAPIRWLVDDCKKFVEREIRRGNKYDGIIMDPPSYGRGKNGEVWKFEQNIEDLVTLCMQVLSDKPLFFLINSYTTGISSQVLENILRMNFEKSCKAKGKFENGEIGLPMTNSKLVLPCGIYGRWES